MATIIQPLNKRATNTFLRLIDRADRPGETIVFGEGGTYMPVYVTYIHDECVGRRVYRRYTIAHHYAQNGDLMADPTMDFLVTTWGYQATTRDRQLNTLAYPVYYRQDSPQYITDALEYRYGVAYVRWRAQRQLATFANKWMSNIREQQKLPRLQKVKAQLKRKGSTQ